MDDAPQPHATTKEGARASRARRPKTARFTSTLIRPRTSIW